MRADLGFGLWAFIFDLVLPKGYQHQSLSPSLRRLLLGD